MAKRRRLAIAGGVLVVVLGGGAVAVASGAGGSSTAPDTAGMDVSVTSATVQRRDLVVTETFTGELAYSDSRAITSGRSGTVTTMASPGSVVPIGSPLFSVDLEPAILLTGTIPAFRTLDDDSTDGPDIQQLEQALSDLGYGTDMTVDGNFTAVTADAVEAWETDLGRADPDGVVELGDVVFASGDLRVSSVLAEVGAMVQTGGPVMDVTTTAKIVAVDLDADRSSDLETGTVVDLSLPDGTDTTGTVTDIGTEAESSPTDPNTTPTVPVQITLADPATATGFDSGSVDVTLERSREDAVLAVPVTALLALSEGGYALEVLDDPQTGASHLVRVEIGTVADGYVAVTGDGVDEGVAVVLPA